MTSPYQDNASDILPLCVSATSSKAERNEQMIQVAQALCPFLKSHDNLTVTPLSGGLSNELFIVQQQSSSKDDDEDSTKPNQSVLVRLHPSINSNLP